MDGVEGERMGAADVRLTLKVVGEGNADLVRRAKVILRKWRNLTSFTDRDGSSNAMQIVRDRVLIVLIHEEGLAKQRLNAEASQRTSSLFMRGNRSRPFHPSVLKSSQSLMEALAACVDVSSERRRR